MRVCEQKREKERRRGRCKRETGSSGTALILINVYRQR
jgi:hypothetical protein